MEFTEKSKVKYFTCLVIFTAMCWAVVIGVVNTVCVTAEPTTSIMLVMVLWVFMVILSESFGRSIMHMLEIVDTQKIKTDFTYDLPNDSEVAKLRFKLWMKNEPEEFRKFMEHIVDYGSNDGNIR